ncbi:MAG TPA: LytTR family DNA-binding domain-containing protein, partial [Verrucomicrobiae bacterium]|nr:LytTR family DNA-binding domain-containing protein [Verrucomicrobiae bacterium]
GFGVLRELADGPLPLVVFVTAHDQFALKAFEVHAVDYLLKPFDKERLQKTLARVIERFQAGKGGGLDEKIAALLSGLKPEAPRATDRIAVKTDGRVLLLKADDVDWIEAADNYVVLHAGNETHTMRETMSALEERLAPDKFLRISRSTIVNLEKIKELQPMFHGEYVVILRNNARLTLSRGYRDRLQQLLGKLG